MCAVPFAGYPLLVHCIQNVQASQLFQRVIVVTDDHSLGEMVRLHGCIAVPSGQSAAMIQSSEIRAELSPLCPFVQREHLAEGLQLLRGQNGGAVHAVIPRVGVFPPGQSAQPLAGMSFYGHPSDAIRCFEVPALAGFQIGDMAELRMAQSLFEVLPRRGRVMPVPGDLDLICYDFDGVLTDNKVIVDENGKESVAANRGDGLAIAAMRAHPISQIILSTETNPVVRMRAAKLNIEVVHGLDNKAKTLRQLIEHRGLKLERVMFVGNDTNDAEVMSMVGHPVAPADAHPAILAIAHHVTRATGGNGVIRELYDRIFRLNTETL